jgi:hypothetical protein
MELYFCFCGVQSCETDSQFMVNKWWRLYTRYICGPIYEGKVPLGSLRRRICGRVVQVSSGTWSFDGFKTDVIRRARGCNHWLTVRRDANKKTALWYTRVHRKRSSIIFWFFVSWALFFRRDNMRFSILRVFLLHGLCSADFTLRVWCTRGGLGACRPYLYSKFLTVESVYRCSASVLRRSVLQAADLVSQCRHLARQCGKDISGCIIRIHFLGDRLQKRGL